MSTLNSRLQLSILNRKKSKNLAEKGFTLIELLITVVILGTLSAIALPNFLGVAESADQKSAIASATAMAKDCSTSIVAELTAPTQTEATAPKGVTLVDTEVCGTNLKNYKAAGLTPALNDLCLADKAVANDVVCTISVATTGAVTGTWGAT